MDHCSIRARVLVTFSFFVFLVLEIPFSRGTTPSLVGGEGFAASVTRGRSRGANLLRTYLPP